MLDILYEWLFGITHMLEARLMIVFTIFSSKPRDEGVPWKQIRKVRRFSPYKSHIGFGIVIFM